MKEVRVVSWFCGRIGIIMTREEIEKIIVYQYTKAGNGKVDLGYLSNLLDMPKSTISRLAGTYGLTKHRRVYKETKFEIKENGCWEWISNFGGGGYGRITINDVRISAHVYMYEQKYGKIPDNLDIDHKCRNRKCVNPDHLEAVPLIINNRRGALTKYPQELIDRIRKEFNEGKSYKDIAKDENMKYATVVSYISNPIRHRRDLTEYEKTFSIDKGETT